MSRRSDVCISLVKIQDQLLIQNNQPGARLPPDYVSYLCYHPLHGFRFFLSFSIHPFLSLSHPLAQPPHSPSLTLSLPVSRLSSLLSFSIPLKIIWFWLKNLANSASTGFHNALQYATADNCQSLPIVLVTNQSLPVSGFSYLPFPSSLWIFLLINHFLYLDFLTYQSLPVSGFSALSIASKHWIFLPINHFQALDFLTDSINPFLALDFFTDSINPFQALDFLTYSVNPFMCLDFLTYQSLPVSELFGKDISHIVIWFEKIFNWPRAANSQLSHNIVQGQQTSSNRIFRSPLFQ